MLMSTECPTCHAHIEHEDYLFEVSCSCGTRYNPYLVTNSENKNPLQFSQSDHPSFDESKKTFLDIANFDKETEDPHVSSSGAGGESPKLSLEHIGDIENLKDDIHTSSFQATTSEKTSPLFLKETMGGDKNFLFLSMGLVDLLSNKHIRITTIFSQIQHGEIFQNQPFYENFSSAWEKAKKGLIAKALKHQVQPNAIIQVQWQIQSLSSTESMIFLTGDPILYATQK